MEQIISYFIILMSVAFTAYTIGLHRKALRSKSWPKVTGIIRTHDIHEHSSSDGSWYTPIIKYGYKVRDVYYRGKTISFSLLPISNNYDSALRYTFKYKKGDEVRVYYNPDKHRESVLEPGSSILNLMIIVFLVLFDIVLIFFIEFA